MRQGRFGWLEFVVLVAFVTPFAPARGEPLSKSSSDPTAQTRANISIELSPDAEVSTIGSVAGTTADSGAGPAVLTKPADAMVDVVLCSENFESQFPGNSSCDWTLKYCGQGYTWDEDVCRASSGSYSAWCANGRYTNQNGLNPCSSYYPDNTCSWMIAGPYDLSDATAASVQYDYWLRCEGDFFDFLYVGYSTNGTSFTGGDQFSGDFGDVWNRNRTLSLQSVVGRTQVWIGFAFLSDGSYHFNSLPDGAFIDNIRVAKTAGSAPDLIVTSLGFDNTSCPTQVRAMVRNQGTAGCGANTCRFWRGQTQLSDVGIHALAAGEADWSGWSPLGNYTPGDYAIRGCADIAGQIQEQDETNNCLTVNYTGWCLSPDLTVTALGFDNASCPTQVRAKVKNIGGATAAASSCRFWMDDVLKGNATIRSLAANEEDWSGWCAIGSPTGDHAVRSCVDPDGTIVEGNENNNCLTGNYTAWCLAPDLQVATLQFDPPNCATRMRAEVRNAGTSAAASSICRFTVDATQKCDITVASLAAGASAWTDWCSIGASQPGTKLGAACADATNLVAESNENNNCLSQNFACSANEFYIPSGLQFSAGAGNVDIPIYALNTERLTAFSLSICLDPDVFVIRGATVTGTRAAGASNVIVSDPQDGCISVAVVYSHGCPTSIPAGDGAVLKLQLTVVPGAPVGLSPISLTDRPPSLNRMTLCDFSTIVPGFGTTTIEILSNGFIRGDYDASGSLALPDALAGLYFVVGEGAAPTCEDSGDLNDDGVIDVSDAVYSLGFLYGGGSAPAPPYPGCGDDPTSDDLGCVSFAGCAPSAPARAGNASVTGPESTMDLSARYSAMGDTLTVPMALQLSEAAVGFDVTLAFDPAVLDYVGLARSGEASEYDFCSARLLDSANLVRFGAVRDLGLRSGIPAGRHPIGAMVFLVRDAKRAEGSRVEVTEGHLVTGPTTTVRLEGAGLALPRFGGSVPGGFTLRLTNPYRPGLPIALDLIGAADTRLTIYNVHGRKVRDLATARFGAGHQEIPWDGKGNGGEDAGAGVYYLSGAIGEQAVHRKLILIR